MKGKLLLLSLMTVVWAVSCTKPQFSEVEENAVPSQGATSALADAALASLQDFMSEVMPTKAGEDIRTKISSIDTLFSSERKDASGACLPEAFLVNFADDGGFAVLDADSRTDAVIAVVENGSTTWEKILNPPKRRLSSFEKESPDPGISPERLLSMCIRGALYGVNANDEEKPVETKTTWSVNILPLTDSLRFGQQITYCHKNNRGFVVNGCASTAISIVMAHNKYPNFTIDSELINYRNCIYKDGSGYRYTFKDTIENTKDYVYVKTSDYFHNYAEISISLMKNSLVNRIDLIEQIDPGVVNTHGIPVVSLFPYSSFYRTRYKLTSGVFYKMNRIVQSWNSTGAMPAAVENCLENLGYENVSRNRKQYLSTAQINTIRTMLEDDKPVIVCGWSLLELSNSHYWVVDGLRQSSSSTASYIHCNWGWDGTDNGWFSSNCIRPSSEVTLASVSPATNDGTDNDWGQIVVYQYDLNSTVPSRSVSKLNDNFKVTYEPL